MTVSPGDPGERRDGPPSLRIGDAERNAAADALQQHLAAGRLTLDEYADRSAVVMNARTQDEVDRVFGDLPPVAGAAGAAGAPALRPLTGSSVANAAGVPPVPAQRPGPSRAVLGGLMGGMPIIALLLFLWTGQWWWFLLIPLAYTVLGPMLNRGGDGDGRQLERGPDR